MCYYGRMDRCVILCKYERYTQRIDIFINMYMLRFSSLLIVFHENIIGSFSAFIFGIYDTSEKNFPLFIRPSSDGTYYGMVMSVRVSVRPFSALFSYTLWHIELKFCTWLCFSVLQIKFECCHFASIFERVMPLCELRI